MQFTTFALVAAAASIVSAQGVTSVLTPTASAPAGCSTNFAGNFEITVVLPAKTKRDGPLVEKRAACGGSGTLVAALKGGVLTDALGRIGAIVANRQFQFDGPPAQTGSIYTGGWSVCGNGSLALGGSTVFYQCLSGTFYNLYDRSTGAQCNAVEIDVIPCGPTSGATSGATQVTDGQIQASSAVTRASQITDGQVQATSAVSRVTQISDGQIQATSAVTRVSQISDGQIQATVAVTRVSQISDGQIQATSAIPRTTTAATRVSQISDGQIQATSAVTRVSQISDGQIQATSAVTRVSQISDGQIQATAATSRMTTSTTTRAPVSQISDGQIQATTAANRTTAAATTTARFTGAAAPIATVGAQLIAGAVAIVGFAML